MSGLIYSIPYQVFIAICIVLALLDRHFRNRMDIRPLIRGGCIVLYLLFIGLRGHIGTDWYNYYRIFEDVPSLTQGGLGEYVSENLLEPGFLVLVSFVKTIWADYHFFVFVSACLDVFVIHLFLKRYTDWYALGFLVFMVMGGLTLCELLRNVRGIMLFLLSLCYLQERRALPYFLLNGLGILFHITSVFYLPLYWFLHRRWSVALLAAVFVVGNLLFWLHIEFMRPLVEWGAGLLGGRFSVLQSQYLLDELFDQRYGLSVGYFERIVTALLVMGFYRKLLQGRQTNVLFVNAFTLYFACFFFFSEIREFSARFSLLFVFGYWVIFLELYRAMRVRGNRVLFLCALFLYAWLKMAGMTSNILYRYDNVLWGVERYDRRAEEFERFYLNR